MGSNEDPSGTDRELMSAADVGRTISRIAHQIIEKTALDDPAGPAKVILLGIPTRGVTLAARLAEQDQGVRRRRRRRAARWTSRSTATTSTSSRRVRWRTPRYPRAASTARSSILVDDVLYTGRSVRSALDALRDIGRPRAVQLAVLVDRGHRELPLRADYVGKNVPTSRSENVKVRLAENDGVDGIWIAPYGGPTR